ncbi:MAG: signal peptidase II [Spartobacteria bacterium]
MKLLLFITLPLYLLDQVTKWLVLRFIATDEFVPVIPGVFYLVQVHNTGAAFGMLKNNNLFFMILASVALVLVAVFARRGFFADAPSRFGAALLVSGVLGNLTDRILHGYVIDFLDVILPWYGHWPAFNVADSAICAAAALFLISGFLNTEKKN